MADTPSINSYDVIIPVYRPGERFLRLFAALKEQSLPFGKLIIINTEASLMSPEIRKELEKDGRVILRDIGASDFDHAATRDMGVRLSKADAFICMTDDAVPADCMLTRRLIEALEQDDNRAAAYARQLPAEDAEPAERIVRSFNYPDRDEVKRIEDTERLGIKTFFASNVCCAYRRDIYDSLGGFEAPAVFNEDMVYACRALKAGRSTVYCAAACVLHSHNYTALQQFHRNFDLGVSQRLHPEVFAGLSSEGEGMKLVRTVIGGLAAEGHFVQIAVFAFRTAFRYAGFRLGKCFDRLPDRLVMSFAMNKNTMSRIIERRKK